MRTFLFLGVLIFYNIPCFSQSLQKEVQHADIASKLFHSKVQADGRIKGSPYTQRMFAQANVVHLNIKAYMRYNAYKDEFEFISPKNDTLILDKIEDFNTIDFVGMNRKYDLLPYTTHKKLVYGYLINLHEKNGLTLYKKENVTFTEEKLAKTSLERNMPAKYQQMSDSYFFKDNSGTVIDFPDSKKSLLKMFPNKKDALESFIKQNKPDYNNAADLIKILDLVATN